jgi:hypothetical protein
MKREATKPSVRARREFAERVQFWAARLKVGPSQVHLRPMSRKWASCSTLGRVTFSYALMRQPVEFREYVIVHELLHLRVPNHGRLFRSLMSVHLPRWRNATDQMDKL